MATTHALDDLLAFHQNALDLRAFRQQLLAANIANADTPGYKARDIDFAAALQEAARGKVSRLGLAPTHAGHLPGAPTQGPAAVLYRSVQQPSIDGNTVDMDVERGRFAENAVHYEANIAFITAQLKLMQAALQGN